MRIRSPRVSVVRVLPPASVAAIFLAMLFSGTSIAAPRHVSATQSPSTLTGTWSGRYGGAVSGTFTLRWRQVGSALRGSIKLSNPPGTYPIAGSLHGSMISFGAVGVGATYTGTVAGWSMSGRWKSANRGGTWSARKTS
jgi:hypothetical protein